MTLTDNLYDQAHYEASKLTLGTLVPGVDYTLVRHNDSSDHGRAELFFADRNDAERYVTRLKAAFAAGALGEPHFHPQPATLDLLIYAVTRHPTHATTLRHEPGSGYVWTCTCGAKSTAGKQHLLAEQDAQEHARNG